MTKPACLRKSSFGALLRECSGAGREIGLQDAVSMMESVSPKEGMKVVKEECGLVTESALPTGPMEEDGCRFLRMLKTGIRSEDVQEIKRDWKLHVARRTDGEESAREVLADIKSLKKIQATADPQSLAALQTEISRREGDINKWHILLLKGLVYNVVTQMERVQNGAQLRERALRQEVACKAAQVEDVKKGSQAREQALSDTVGRKSAEIESIRRFAMDCSEQLAEKSKFVSEARREASFAEKDLAVKSKMFEELRKTVSVMTDSIAEKDAQMDIFQQKMKAEHARLRADVENKRKDYLESYLEESLKAVRDGRLRLPSRGEAAIDEKNVAGGHKPATPQMRAKRMRECARGGPRSAPDKLPAPVKRLRRKCQKYGMDA